MRPAFILIFILNTLSLSGQNYQAVTSGVPRFFIDTTGYIKAIKMDSVSVTGNDSLLYPFKTARDTMSVSFSIGCIDGYGPSWIGHTVVVRADGTNIFLNKNNDSIYFYTQAQTGNSWTLYTFQNSDYVKATITAMASADSVKYISLQVKNSAGINIPHPLNGKQFILSKDNGFIQLYDFYFFPDYNSWNVNSSKFILSNDHVPTVGERHDYDVGDEFEQHSYTSLPIANPGSYTRHLVVSKNISAAGDTVCYDVYYRNVGYWVVWNPTPHLDSTVSTGINTFCITNLTNPLVNGMPEQSLDVTGNWHQFIMHHNADYCGKIRVIIESGWNQWSATDGCLFANNFEPPYDGTTIIPGCIPGFFYHGDPMSSYQTDVTYIKKDSCVYGYPHISTNIAEHEGDPEFIVSPNPASTSIFIKSHQHTAFKIEMLNLAGECVLSENFYDSRQPVISIEHLAGGVYFLRIISEKNTFFRKIVVSR